MAESKTTTAQDTAQDLYEIYTTASLQSMEHLALVTRGIEYHNVGKLGVSAEELTEMVCERMQTKPPPESVTGPMGTLFEATVSRYWGTLDTPGLQDIVDTASLIGRDIFQTGTPNASPIYWANVKRMCQGNNKIVERHNGGDDALKDVDIIAFLQDVAAARHREKAAGKKYRNAKGNQDQKAEMLGAIVAAGYGEHLTEDQRKAAKASSDAAAAPVDPDHEWLVAIDVLRNACYGNVVIAKTQAFVAEMEALQGYLGVFKANLAAPVETPEPVVTTV